MFNHVNHDDSARSTAAAQPKRCGPRGVLAGWLGCLLIGTHARRVRCGAITAEHNLRNQCTIDQMVDDGGQDC